MKKHVLWILLGVLLVGSLAGALALSGCQREAQTPAGTGSAPDFCVLDENGNEVRL